MSTVSVYKNGEGLVAMGKGQETLQKISDRINRIKGDWVSLLKNKIRSNIIFLIIEYTEEKKEMKDQGCLIAA